MYDTYEYDSFQDAAPCTEAIPVRQQPRQSFPVYMNHSDADRNTSLTIIECHSSPDILLHTGRQVRRPIIQKCNSNPEISVSDKRCSNDCVNMSDDMFYSLEELMTNMSVLDAEFDRNKSEIGVTELQDMRSVDYNIVDRKQSATQVDNLTTKLEPRTLTCNKYNFKDAIPTNNVKQRETACEQRERNQPAFKRPDNPPSHKKSVSTKKYQNIASPVAVYIKRSPLVPLVQGVVPTKRIHGTSAIPVPVKLSQPALNNLMTGNETTSHSFLQLPHIAYKSAKKTKMIKIPDKTKLPQSRWALQVASYLSNAVVIKHTRREVSSKRKLSLLDGDGSFLEGLTPFQADLSVCTQHSAFKELQ